MKETELAIGVIPAYGLALWARDPWDDGEGGSFPNLEVGIFFLSMWSAVPGLGLQG